MSRTVVTLERTSIEVPAPRNGRPGYRWTTGFYVIGPDGLKQYPPVVRKEAYASARTQWPGCTIKLTDETR